MRLNKMKNITLQSSLIFGFLYTVSIIISPSIELAVEGSSSKLSYDASFRFMIFSILAFIYYLMKSKTLKIENGAKITLIFSIIFIVLIIDLISWYFIGIYKYEGVSNFISFYVITIPMMGGFALFISIFIAEIIWKKIKTH